MIQAPNLQYIPAQQMNIPAYTPQGANSPVQYYNQAPGVIYNYPMASSYLPQSCSNAQPRYNGVNIEIHNPQGQAGMPVAMPAQYMPVQQPFYPQPVYQPAMPQQPIVQQPAVPAEPIAPQQQQVPAPQIPAPQIPAQPAVPAPAPAAAPVVEQPAANVAPAVNLTSFSSRLKSENVDEQRAAIEELAESFKYDNKFDSALLDTEIVDSLIGIIDKDTSSLEGPSPEVLELRQKPEAELTEAQKEQAKTPAPIEKAEVNKTYALYTLAYLQERLNNEIQKGGVNALELKDLPGIDKVVDTVKANPNPMLRVCGIAALSHIARPEYNADLKTIFELAKNDKDADVQEAAEKALSLLK